MNGTKKSIWWTTSAVASFVVAVGLALVSLSHYRPVLLLSEEIHRVENARGPPVEYVASMNPDQGYHIEWVPAQRLAKSAHTHRHAQSAGMSNHAPGRWTYVPASSLLKRAHSRSQRPGSNLRKEVRSRRLVLFDGKDEAAAAAPDEADEAAALAHPFDGERSCGLRSLVEQALAIFPRWDSCGYMKADSQVGDMGYISAPENNVECTPSMMDKGPCRKGTLRKVKKGSVAGLQRCLASIKGLSQACYTYDKCGPIALSGPFAGRRSSVCYASEGDYYKEAAVQRMCGICGMWHAQSPHDAHTTPDDSRVAAAGWFAAMQGLLSNEAHEMASLL